MLKRLVLFLVLVVAVVAAFGCVTNAAAAPKKLRIGISIPSADHGWTGGVVYWAKEAMKANPDIDFTLALAENADKQVSQIEDMLQKGIDGLVLLAYESAPLTPIAKKAHEKGVFIVNVDRGLLEDVVDVYIAGDNNAFGKVAGEYIAKRLGGKGNVVVMEGVACTVNTDRVTGFNDVMKKYPGIKVLASQPADWQREKGLSVMENYLQKFPKIDAVWASDDDIALGAIQAIKEAKRDKEMFVVPGAGMKDVVKMVMDGSTLVPVDVTYPPSMVATGVSLCVYGLKGKALSGFYQKTIPRTILLNIELITKSNAKDYYFPKSVY